MQLSPVAAQSVQPTPGSVIAPIDNPVVQPSPGTEASVEGSPNKAFTPPTSNKKIRVERFELVGNNLFDDDTLLEVIADYVDRDITLEQIYQAADSLQRFYRSQGYLLASVYVPAQKISSGRVKLEVVEGRLSSIQIEGDLKSYEAGYLISHFDSMELGEIISSTDLEEKLLLLNDLPGLTARALILPGASYGSSDIAIQTLEDRSKVTLRVNNHGRKSLGELRLEAGWLLANPFLQGDQINLSTIVAQDSRMIFLRADYDTPLNVSGTRIGFGLSNFNYEVDTEELQLAGTLEGDGTNLRLLVTHPLIRKQRNRLDISAVYRSSETSEDGSLSVSTSPKSIDVVDFSLIWQPTHDDGAKSNFALTLSSNFKDNPAGTETDALKSKLTLNYSYNKGFAQHWFALFSANLVTSADPLPDQERYRLGGPTSVRAYPSAELAGDEGQTFRFDVGRRFLGGGRTNYIVKLFADTGKVKRIIPAAGEEADESLSGFGAGLAIDFGGGHAIDLEVVTPTTDRVSSDDSDPRVWLNYSAQF